ncbi:aminopeptidase P family protein [Miniphocaeibacter massiliensis]|uniref:aminopeptidase P family protein n=1 Tax=Miniphocaeibacter massiliensis TaxID=2041841 RepID=UPI000C0886D4|nr:aminopeptidase P family protein [Miniphocaeibacter massiliensis]
MVKYRIEKLRELMKKENIDAYIIPTADPHQSEYVADFYKSREFISGFTGSSGTVVIGKEKAGLWTDGRYFIQAAKELEGSGIDLYKLGVEGTQSISDFIKENVEDDGVVAFNGETYSYRRYATLLDKLQKINFKSNYTLVEDIWEDRPEKPSGKMYIYDIKYTGVSAKAKIDEIRNTLKDKGLTHYLISSLEDICYLFNIRGSDVEFNPVVISYVLISEDFAKLYVDLNKVDEKTKAVLKENGITVEDYDSVFDQLSELDNDSNLYLDPRKINVKIYKSINSVVNIEKGPDFTLMMKSIKNDIEIENQRNAYVKDCVALVKFFNWLEENVPNEEITELDAADKLLEFRKQGDLFIEASFGTISAYGENAALPHYSPNKGNPVVLKNRGLYLLDSGGHYLDGTTDITRTVALGELTEDEKYHYTYTLKSHIALLDSTFAKGTKSSSLDIFARGPLWKERLDFNHGTGHGVGYLLSVHEGPQSISKANNNIDMVPGMITSDEPGIYIEGSHGIRIENIMLCIEKFKNDFGTFYGFESLSLCPIDLRPVKKELLTESEKDWINKYHKECFDVLSKYLGGSDLEYLKEMTKSI